MTEIKELKKNIINYAKTKDVFMAYRQSGFSANFYEENIENLLIHQSAKKALVYVDKNSIPTIKNLQSELMFYNEMKKDRIKKFSILKKQMKDVLTVKSNIDHLIFQSSKVAIELQLKLDLESSI